MTHWNGGLQRSLAVAFFVAFWVAVPVNRWLIGMTKGHAVVHAYHHHG